MFVLKCTVCIRVHSLHYRAK